MDEVTYNYSGLEPMTEVDFRHEFEKKLRIA